MGLFSFGGSKSKSSSSSFSSSFDNLDAFGFGADLSTSTSRSGGQSTSFDRSGSRSRSTQNVAFGDVFARLFGDAQAVAGGIDTAGITDAANLLFRSGGDLIDNLENGGAGAAFLEESLADDRFVEDQIGLLGDDISRFLAEDVNPAITSGGVQAGTFGGTRGEVQRGIATRGATEAFTRGATELRVADAARRDNIASTLMASEADRAGASLNALPELFGLAEAGALADLSPLAALSQILGPQIALTDSAATSFGEGGSQSTQFSEALAEALGISFDSTTGRAGSTSRSNSSSSSRSARFEFGGG